MMSAFQTAIGGWGFHVFAGEFLVGQTRAMIDELEKLRPQLARRSRGRPIASWRPRHRRCLTIARAVADSAMALEAIEIEGEKSINYLCSLPNVKRLATSFQSAAGSNLAYFDSLIIAEVAKAFSLPPDQAKIRFAGFEPDYLVGVHGRHHRRHDRPAPGAEEGVGRGLDRVGPVLAGRQRAVVLPHLDVDLEVVLARRAERPDHRAARPRSSTRRRSSTC